MITSVVVRIVPERGAELMLPGKDDVDVAADVEIKADTGDTEVLPVLEDGSTADVNDGLLEIPVPVEIPVPGEIPVPEL